MNPFEFVLAILLMVFVFSIIKHKMGIPDRSLRGTHDAEKLPVGFQKSA